MTRKWPTVGLIAVVAALAGGWMTRFDAKPAADRSGDELAIRTQSQGLAKAFERGDASAIAAFWTEDGEYVDDNSPPIHGREALQAAYAKFFANRKAVTVETNTKSVRFLGPDVAVEDGAFSVKAKDQPTDSSKYTSLFVRQSGKWLIASMKEWDDETKNQAKLEDIAWLIGNWQGGGEMTAQTTYEWTENKRFIRMSYNVTRTGRPNGAVDKSIPQTGFQLIGVDPATCTIRTWTFAVDGGIGEATWTWDDGRWIIESVGTLADGLPTTATNILVPTGADSFTWTSTRRTIGNEQLPDLPAVTVNRTRGAQ